MRGLASLFSAISERNREPSMRGKPQSVAQIQFIVDGKVVYTAEKGQSKSQEQGKGIQNIAAAANQSRGRASKNQQAQRQTATHSRGAKEKKMGRIQKQARRQQVDSLESPESLAQSENISEDEPQVQQAQKQRPALAGKKRSRPERLAKPQDSGLLNKSDDECDDDELIDKLEEQQKRKKDQPIDFDKMTRRQKMAYMAQQSSTDGPSAPQSISIVGGAADLGQLTGDDNVLYSLGSRKARMVGSDGLPMPKPKKSAISQEQADEIKRQQFLKILEDQQKKIKEREVKLKQKTTGIMAGVSCNGRPICNTQNAKPGAPVGGMNARWRPGMEQFINAIKLKSNGDKVQLCMPQGFLVPEVLRQKPASELLSRMEMRRKKSKCSYCKKPDAKKYVCSRTKAVTCSFECYKAVKAAH